MRARGFKISHEMLAVKLLLLSSTQKHVLFGLFPAKKVPVLTNAHLFSSPVPSFVTLHLCRTVPKLCRHATGIQSIPDDFVHFWGM